MLINLAKRTEKHQEVFYHCTANFSCIPYLKSRQLDQIQAPFVLLTSAL